MPTYEYVCEKCEHPFEQFQSMKDAPLTICPKEKCGMKKWGKGKVRKQMSSGAGLIFKGSGFYITDYRSESYKEAAKKDVPASTGDAKKSESAAPAKSEPAPKAEKPAKAPKAKE